MKKYFVVILMLVVIFISACKVQETVQGNKQKYENKDLGITFEYPSNFKVYQADKDTLRIDSGYKNTEHSAVEAVMGIRRINTNRETSEQIQSRINPDLSSLSDVIKSLESSTTKEAYDQLVSQIEFSKKSNPELYKAVHGDKTSEEVATEQVESVKKQIVEFRQKQNKKNMYTIKNNGNYELVNVENGKNYYILSNKGTFIIDNTLDISFWKPLFEKDGVYQEYKDYFDQIRN